MRHEHTAAGDAVLAAIEAHSADNAAWMAKLASALQPGPIPTGSARLQSFSKRQRQRAHDPDTMAGIIKRCRRDRGAGHISRVCKRGRGIGR